ncbi:Poly [ADP-ribose] polymerase 1, partial [Nowakowskiella sp. JEL0078]
MPAINTEEIIKAKLEMLDTLMEIEEAQKIIGQGMEDDGIDPIDSHYRGLKTDLEVIPKNTPEWNIIEECTRTTHAPTHNQYKLNILEVFKVMRQGERERFDVTVNAELSANKMLLWHGSRTTNFGGILSQGLRIAPPEAPVTGYMFGKGVYFADMVSKSANYCFPNRSQTTGLLLLCEVACGDMMLRNAADFITSLPDGKHSTKGCGSTGPDRFVPLPEDASVLVPLGPPKHTAVTGSLLYNEYIVYDVGQINIRYMIKV